LYCHAGCQFDEVVSALNLEKRDLFPAKDRSPRRRIAKVYQYTDETGTLLYEVVRFEPKKFRPRRSDGKGGWLWEVSDVRRVLYRLVEVRRAIAQSKRIYFPEGEKDVENLRALGLAATTTAFGAKAPWNPAYTDQLRGAAEVVLLADNDAPGQQRVETAAKALLGAVKVVKTLLLPNLPAKGDVSDWLAAGGTSEELERLAELAPEAGQGGKHHHAGRSAANVGNATTELDPAHGGADSKKTARERIVLKGTNLHELAALLESSEGSELTCGGDLRFDEMHLAPSVGGVPFDDAKYLDVQRRIEQFYSGPRGGSLQLSKERVRDAIQLAADKRSYHPVRDYLGRLKWDGVERISSVLEDILGVESTELSQAIMRKFFISAVARPMQPGCKADHVLILVGPQDLGKSRFFDLLAGSEWFSDSVIDIQNRDSYLLLRRVWILEWSELEAMQRARHQDAVKAFITSRVDLYRAPYGRTTEAVPRTSIIVGTTNSDAFLADATGNRRYWPIRSGKAIDLKRLAEVRDQLWAEAVVAFQKGEQWWLTPALEERLQRAHEEFEQQDPWTEPILRSAQGCLEPSTLTTAYLLKDGLDKPKGQWTRADEMRVASIMRKAGWDNHQVRVGTDRMRRWFAPTNGWDRHGRLGQKSSSVSTTAQPSQPSHPISEEEEEEVTARARGERGALQGLSGDHRVLAETVETLGRGVQ
jgi:hypothetical protein